MSIRIKICGLTHPDDIYAAEEYGADAIGLNFHPSSPRFVEPKSAIPLMKAVSPLMTPIGVWVAQPVRQICAIAYQLGLRSIQWYGDPQEFGDAFPFSYIAGFRVKDRDSLRAIEAYLTRAKESGTLPGAILIDAYVEGQMGGTGKKAPWELLADFKASVPWILAGGLTPDNVAEAIRQVRPDGVDVASGVESAPGKKDHSKMKDFIQSARSVLIN